MTVTWSFYNYTLIPGQSNPDTRGAVTARCTQVQSGQTSVYLARTARQHACCRGRGGRTWNVIGRKVYTTMSTEIPAEPVRLKLMSECCPPRRAFGAVFMLFF